MIEYIRDFDIDKYFRDKIILDPAIYQTCNCLKENCLNYQKKICEFQKNLLKIKEKFPRNNKIFFELDEKNNLFNSEKFLLLFSSLI